MTLAEFEEDQRRIARGLIDDLSKLGITVIVLPGDGYMAYMPIDGEALSGVDATGRLGAADLMELYWAASDAARFLESGSA